MRTKRITIALHRWLGIGLGLVLAMWFASGIVLWFVPFPKLTPVERLAGLPEFAPRDCCLPPAPALALAGIASAHELRLDAADGAPRYRVRETAGGGWTVLDARSATRLPPASLGEAAEIAERFAATRGTSAGVRAVSMIERDQWTVPQRLDPYRPLARVTFDDGAATELYVSLATREVVRDTTRSERFWNWLGAVPHWIYPTVLRERPALWREVVIWIALPGVVLVATGIVLGIWQLRRKAKAMIPYRERWMRWHHGLGLACMAFAFTWMISGLFSMNPFGLLAPRTAAAAYADAWTGGALSLERFSGREWAAIDGRPVEIVVRAPGGSPHFDVRWRDGRRALIAAGTQAPRAPLASAEIEAAAARAHPGRPIAAVDTLTRHDEYYYTRRVSDGERPLPMVRVRFSDGTWLHVDPASGELADRSDPTTRARRWLFNALHSLDWAWMRERPVLHATTVVGLNLVGLALSITGLVMGIRRLRALPGRVPAFSPTNAHRVGLP